MYRPETPIEHQKQNLDPKIQLHEKTPKGSLNPLQKTYKKLEKETKWHISLLLSMKHFCHSKLSTFPSTYAIILKTLSCCGSTFSQSHSLPQLEGETKLLVKPHSLLFRIDNLEQFLKPFSTCLELGATGRSFTIWQLNFSNSWCPCLAVKESSSCSFFKP